MTLSPRACQLAGIALAALVLTPPVARLLEARMLGHMLVQIPALWLAGAMMAWPVCGSRRVDHWNMAGVPGLLAASLVLAFWMLPIALDHAVASAAWDAAKALSLLLAGALGVVSWRRAPLVIQAFFVGNVVWMSIAIGVLYQDDGPRLCNAYLLDDQGNTGLALVLFSLLAAGLWMGRTALRLQTGSPRIDPPPEDAVHEN